MKKEVITPPAKRGRKPGSGKSSVNRILVGVRIEPKLVKVMKALAELNDLALGELIEQVIWKAMDGDSAFAEKGGKMSAEMRGHIQSLKSVYGVNYELEDLTPNRSKA